MTINLLLLIAAAVCFLLSTVNVPSRVNLQSLGLLLWVMALIIVGRIH